MNSNVRKIIAWHPVLTDHQAFTYQALSEQSELPMTVYVSSLEDSIRQEQGWVDTRVTGIDRQLIPKRGFLRYAMRALLANREQLHIFGSAFESPRMMLVLWFAACLRIDFYIISEPYSPVPYGYFIDHAAWRERLKSWARPWLYRTYMLALRSSLKGIFTISRLAKTQYAKAGMSAERLFPFGYFVPTEKRNEEPLRGDQKIGKPMRLAFVGALISRKGLPMLITAVRCAFAQNANIQLDVYGPGEVSSFDFDDAIVRYQGAIPFGETQKYLNRYDFLVLPSYFDGWGVVVNEALCAGVPVLCSDQVGARELVEMFGAGQVFPSGDVQALTSMLVDLSTDVDRCIAMTSACSAASRAIQPDQAAAYMLAIFSNEPSKREAIASPWYRPSES